MSSSESNYLKEIKTGGTLTTKIFDKSDTEREKNRNQVAVRFRGPPLLSHQDRDLKTIRSGLSEIRDLIF